MITNFAVFCCVAAVYAATTTNHPHPTHPHVTHAPHTTHEPNESEGITFYYNGLTHDLIVKQNVNMLHNCYIASVTMDERNLVHTDAGLRTLELRVLGQLATATPAMASSLDAHNVRICGHAPHNATMHYYTIP